MTAVTMHTNADNEPNKPNATTDTSPEKKRITFSHEISSTNMDTVTR